ncbi:hypothetical protein OROMI_003985 [Orobanche minor]
MKGDGSARVAGIDHMVIQHDQRLAEEADNSMQEADQDYLDSGRSHDVQVALSLPISTISKFSIGVLIGDIEVREASIGEREVLSILKASLTLTDCLKKFTMEPKAEPAT